MNRNYFSNTKALKSGWVSLLFTAFTALAILANPNPARSTDRLVVTDTSGNYDEFAATDGNYTGGAVNAPIIRLNSTSVPSSVPSWALIYGSNSNANTGYTLDSYGSPSGSANFVTLGGGGLSGLRGVRRHHLQSLERETDSDFSYSADMTGQSS